MPTKPTKPGLADWERLLTVSRLQTQAARSVALDGGALGVMAVAAAVAAIVIGVRGADGLWILALALLGSSLGLAVRSLRLPGAEETGPTVADMRKARETEQDEHLLEDSRSTTSRQISRSTTKPWPAKSGCSTML